MHHMTTFSLPHAGGCELGKRTVLPHIYGLEGFGVTVDTKSTRYDFVIDKKTPVRPIIMYESGDTATENVLFAAAINPGVTTIKMASANYQVQDVCLYLQKLGVKISGIGTTTLVIKGLSELPRKSVAFTPSEDPVEAMTFIAAAIATNSEIKISRVPIDFVELELYKIEKMGGAFTYGEPYKADNGHTDLVDITVHKHNGTLTAPEEKVYGRPFPGLNIDNLPYFVPICAVAKGESLIHDWAYEERALMFMDLKKVGVDMTLADIHRVIINGPTRWKPADMVCPQGLRPAVLILIGMLAAKGTSTLRNIYTINRGYEALAERLNSLGAKITVEHGL
jgi:UDP-N-acetylglucosamine 1-carboxyvinyltransferase